MSFSLALQQMFAPNHWNDFNTNDVKLKKQREEADKIKSSIMALMRQAKSTVPVREIAEKTGLNARQVGRLSIDLIEIGKVERVLVRNVSHLKYIRG